MTGVMSSADSEAAHLPLNFDTQGGKSDAEDDQSRLVQRTPGSKGQALGFALPLIPLSITGTPKLLSQSDS